MVFSSVIFVLFFLPIVMAGYFLLVAPALFGLRNRLWWQASNVFLLISSLVFYFWGEKSLIWIFLASILINYAGGLVISGAYRSGDVQQLPLQGPRLASKGRPGCFRLCQPDDSRDLQVLQLRSGELQ